MGIEPMKVNTYLIRFKPIALPFSQSSLVFNLGHASMMHGPLNL